MILREEKIANRAGRTMSVARQGGRNMGWSRIELRKELESLQEEAEWDRIR